MSFLPKAFNGTVGRRRLQQTVVTSVLNFAVFSSFGVFLLLGQLFAKLA